MLSWGFSHCLTDFGEYFYSARVPFVKWQFTTSSVTKGFMRNCLDSMLIKVYVLQKPSVRVCVCPCEVFVVHGQCLVLLPLPCDASMQKKASCGAFHHLSWKPRCLLPWCWDFVEPGWLWKWVSDKLFFELVVQPHVIQKLQSPLETAKGLVCR